MYKYCSAAACAMECSTRLPKACLAPAPSTTAGNAADSAFYLQALRVSRQTSEIRGCVSEAKVAQTWMTQRITLYVDGCAARSHLGAFILYILLYCTVYGTVYHYNYIL